MKPTILSGAQAGTGQTYQDPRDRIAARGVPTKPIPQAKPKPKKRETYIVEFKDGGSTYEVEWRGETAPTRQDLQNVLGRTRQAEGRVEGVYQDRGATVPVPQGNAPEPRNVATGIGPADPEGKRVSTEQVEREQIAGLPLKQLMTEYLKGPGGRTVSSQKRYRAITDEVQNRATSLGVNVGALAGRPGAFAGGHLAGATAGTVGQGADILQAVNTASAGGDLDVRDNLALITAAPQFGAAAGALGKAAIKGGSKLAQKATLAKVAKNAGKVQPADVDPIVSFIRGDMPVPRAGAPEMPTNPQNVGTSLLTPAERQAIYKFRDQPDVLQDFIEKMTPNSADPKVAEMIRIAQETMGKDAFAKSRGQGDNLEGLLQQSIDMIKARQAGADPVDAEIDAIRQRLKAKYAEPETTSPVGDGVAVSEPVAPVATPTTFTPRELSGYDAGTVPNLREGLKAAPEPVAPKPVPAKKAVPGKATKPVSVKGTAAKAVPENAIPNGGKLEDYGDARAIADKVDAAPVAMRRWLYGDKTPYKQNEIEAVRRWMHENDIPMDFEGQKWIDAPVRFMNAWRDHDKLRPIADFADTKQDIVDMAFKMGADKKTVLGTDVGGVPMWTDTNIIAVGKPPKGYSLQPEGKTIPDISRVWTSIVDSVPDAVPVKAIAYSKGAESSRMAMSSADGRIIVFVNPRKMNAVAVLHPGVEWRAVSSSRPVIGMVDGKPVAGVMPMSDGDMTPRVRAMMEASSKLQGINAEIDALKAAQDAKNAKRPTPGKGGRSGAWQRVDAEDWELAGKLAVLYVKKGVATIEEFTANLVNDLGDAIRPHIQELWDAHGPKPKNTSDPDFYTEGGGGGTGGTTPPTAQGGSGGAGDTPKKPMTAMDYAKEASYIARGLKLGADVGALLRQGGEMLINDPIQWARSTKNAFTKTDKAKLTKYYSEMEARTIHGKNMADVRKAAGLKTSHMDTEEAFASKMFDKVPGLNRLENFQKAFLDSGRIERFDSFYRKFPDATDKELRDYAKYLNSAMGKSNVSRVPEALEVVMTSPRWTASRWEMAGRLMRTPEKWVRGALGNKAAKQEARNLGRYAVAMYGMLKVAESQGAQIEFDPRSSDFLKMRMGEKVFDPTSGVAMPIRTALRMMLYARGENAGFGNSAGIELAKTAINTANPVITTPWGLITGKNLTGFELDEEERGAMLMLPLIANGAMESWKKDGPIGAMVQTGTEIVGINSLRYPKKKPEWKPRSQAKGDTPMDTDRLRTGTKVQQLMDKIPL